MFKFNLKTRLISIATSTLVPCLLLTPSYATPIGIFDVADFSNYQREISVGSGIDAGNISSINGFNALNLSTDDEYVRTVGNLAEFTYQSDWSWMSIIQSNQLDNYRVFMRGIAWQDKQGDFDLRIGADTNSMYTWHRAPWWVNANTSDPAINDTDLIWLAGTYDYSDQLSTLYVNGNNVGEFSISPMDDRDNSNPLNINGQWAGNNHGVGNVYGEGDFSIAQLILSQSLFSQTDLQSAYQNHSYMTSDDDTWFDLRINSQVPEPASILLLMTGLLGITRITSGKNRG